MNCTCPLLALTALLVLAASSTSTAAAEGDLRVWTADSLLNMLPSAAAPAAPATSITIEAAANEIESAQVALRSPVAVSGVTARIAQDVAFPASSGPSLRLRWVGLVPLDVNTDDSGWPREPLAPIARAPTDLPDPLLDDASIDLPANTTRALWVDVNVPASTSAGTYRGRIEIHAGGRSIPVPIEVRVFGAQVPQERHLKVLQWLHANQLAGAFKVRAWSDQFWPVLEMAAANMAQHRQNIGFVEMDQVMILRGREDGEWTVDFSLFDRAVETYMAQGVRDGIFAQSLAGRNEWTAPIFNARNFRIIRPDGSTGRFPPPNTRAPSEQFEAFCARFLPILEKHLTEKGWINIYLQSLADEPLAANAAAFRQIGEICRKYAPNIRRCDALRTDRPIDGALDVYVPILASGDTNLAFFDQKRQEGAEVWFYTCERPRGGHFNRFVDHPLIKVRLLHWMNWKLKMPGHLHWGYNYWPNNPFRTLNMGRPAPGDCFIVYPYNGRIADSIRHEAMRDGIEDYELLWVVAQKDPRRADEICNRMIQSQTQYVRDIEQFRRIRRELLEAAGA
mgnify:CR=1 FL=1